MVPTTRFEETNGYPEVDNHYRKDRIIKIDRLRRGIIKIEHSTRPQSLRVRMTTQGHLSLGDLYPTILGEVFNRTSYIVFFMADKLSG